MCFNTFVSLPLQSGHSSSITPKFPYAAPLPHPSPCKHVSVLHLYRFAFSRRPHSWITAGAASGDWLLAVCPRLTRVAVRGCVLSHCMDAPQSALLSPAEGHLGGFQFWAILNKTYRYLRLGFHMNRKLSKVCT